MKLNKSSLIFTLLLFHNTKFQMQVLDTCKCGFVGFHINKTKATEVAFPVALQEYALDYSVGTEYFRQSLFVPVCRDVPNV